MLAFIDQLSSREWVLIILFVAFMAWAMTMPRPRNALCSVVRVLFQRTLVVLFGVVAAYLTMLITALAWVGLWGWDNLLATIFWAVTSAYVTVFKFQEAQSNPLYYRKAVLSVFSLTSLFIFFTDLVPMSLWFWLVVIPLSTLIILMRSIAERQAEHAQVATFLGSVETLVGLICLGFIAWELYHAWDQIACWETVRLFALSAALSIGILPFVFLLTVYDPYDRAFSVMGVYIDDAKLQRAAKWRIMLAFRANVEAVERWRRHILTYRVTSLDELKDSIRQVQQ